MPAAAPLFLFLGDRPDTPPPADGASAPELLELVRAMARADAERDIRALDAAADSTPAESGVRVGR